MVWGFIDVSNGRNLPGDSNYYKIELIDEGENTI